MGQAKRRGTFEQRQAEAIELRKLLDAELEQKRARLRIEWLERDARRTPEERSRSRRANTLLTAALGVIASTAIARNP
jgi:hypothetical protein